MDLSKVNSIKSLIRGDLQKDERNYNKELDKFVGIYKLKFEKSKNIEDDIYKESERILELYPLLRSSVILGWLTVLLNS